MNRVHDPMSPRHVLTWMPPRRRRRLGIRLGPYLMTAPLMALLLTFVVMPGVMALILSFYDWDLLAATRDFVGFENYRSAAWRGELWLSIRTTILYALLTVPSSVALGLLAALGINALIGGRSIWRAVYFLPVASTLVAMAVVWRWIFLGDRGLIDQTVGGWLGLTNWLNSPELALPAVAVVGNWQQIGFVLIIYLAGLAAVPLNLHEAARLDGANAWQRFWHVTWPSLGPATVFVTVLSSIQALRIFDTIATMTEGGPSGRSETLTYLLWKRGIKYFNIGEGAVITLVLLALALLASFIQMRGLRGLERAGTR